MNFRAPVLAKGCAAVVQLAWVPASSMHCSATRRKFGGSGGDLAQEISDNILAAGNRYLKEDKETIRENLRKRRIPVDLESMLEMRERMRLCVKEINSLRRNRNVLTKEHDKNSEAEDDGGSTMMENRETSVDIKQSLKDASERLEVIKAKLMAQLSHVPNTTHPSVPEGGYEASRIVYTHGFKPEFSFPILDHLTIGENHDLIDFSVPAVVSGRNFYYLKGAAALLELALIQYAMQKAVSKGYYPVMTPDIVKTAMVSGCGFVPRTQQNQLYQLLGQSKLCLTGTAEIPLAGMFLGELLPLKKLPLRYVAFGRCFRSESGGYGHSPRGLYRVHQFSKVELFGVTANETGEESETLLQEMVDMQKEIAEELGFHYRVLEMSTEELGSSAYHKYDVEAWMPGRGEYGEICSASNCTDYQSTRLRTAYHNPAFNKDKRQPLRKYAHTVNATACAVPRLILAILENFQQEDGSVLIPKALHPFLPPDSWHIHS